MRPSRRDLLATSVVAVAAGLAGCNTTTGGGATGSPEPTETDESTPTSTPAEETSAGADAAPSAPSADVAVAAEWNAMRARLWDALALGLADEAGTGAAVARHTFARFEAASGEYGAHEMLEGTSEANYEEFEEALGELRSAGLEAGDVGRAREEATIASTQLAEAQRSLVGETASRVLGLQSLGTTVQDAAFLAAAGNHGAARTTAEDTLSRFEEATVHDAFESADREAYEAFERAVEAVASAAADDDPEAVRSSANEAFEAALDGSYALADAEVLAGVGHIAALQARGWDAAALASMGGPSTAFAHAAALTIYRARVRDAGWLAASGETDRAATMASDVFAHFEGARAHEALEEADGEAYEGFEAELSDLGSAIENGDPSGVDEAVATIDSNLVTGIEALAGSNAPLLEAAFFRARFADAREHYRLGENDVAAAIAEELFGRFEENELDVHETVESTSEELYTRFEEEHLGGLIDAFANGDDAGVEIHYEGVQSTLLEFETMAGSTATVSGAEGAYMAARGFDAAVLDALGEDGRAQAIAQGAFEHFESGAGGYHEALEEADESVYEAFEERLGAVSTAAGNGEDVYPAAKQFNAEALASVYAIVDGGGGGSYAGAAATVMQDVFGHFEEARVHGMLEEADHNAYGTFEAQLEAYVTALQEGRDVNAAAESFARAAQYAGFALVDSVEKLPLGLDLAGTAGGGSGSGSGSEEGGGESDLQGGPNVVEGVPDNADHVVDMKAVAYDPAELTVSQGDTVAWRYAAGEPHSVSAYGDGIPDGATYWASGGFESEEAARSGWEDGKGAVQSGQSYVRTFETTGTHEYFCIPHEVAGMVGTVTVESQG
jgi:plastocyanin